MESDDLIVSNGDDGDVSPQVAQKRVIDGDYILKKKNVKGNRAWEQFRIVVDPSLASYGLQHSLHTYLSY